MVLTLKRKKYAHVSNVGDLDDLLAPFKKGHSAAVVGYVDYVLRNSIIDRLIEVYKAFKKEQLVVSGKPFVFFRVNWRIAASYLTANKERLEHALDFLEAFVQKDPAFDLRRLAVKDLFIKTVEWDAELKRQKELEDDAKGSEVLYRWKDGWSVVLLKTLDAFKVEGSRMKHCIGNTNYYASWKKGKEFFLSLRKDNRPVCTLECHPEEVPVFNKERCLFDKVKVPLILQAKGPLNAVIDVEHWARIQFFFVSVLKYPELLFPSNPFEAIAVHSIKINGASSKELPLADSLGEIYDDEEIENEDEPERADEEDTPHRIVRPTLIEKIDDEEGEYFITEKPKRKPKTPIFSFDDPPKS